MYDTDKYSKIYQDILKFQPNDTLQLLLEAESEDEKEFWEIVDDYLLQIKQREIVKKNLF